MRDADQLRNRLHSLLGNQVNFPLRDRLYGRLGERRYNRFSGRLYCDLADRILVRCNHPLLNDCYQRACLEARNV